QSSAEAHAEQSAHVFHGRIEDVDLAITIFYPADRQFADLETELLAKDEHLGIEKPHAVFDLGDDRLDGSAVECLEAALRIGDPQARECRTYKEDVPARGDFSFELAVRPGTAGEAGANGDVATAIGDERDELREVGEV